MARARTETKIPALHIDLDRARAHWHRVQGLAEPVRGPIDEVIGMTGWPRTLGGVDAYLAVLARVPGMNQRELDDAVAASRVQVTPAVRGCIYLVPRAHVPLVMSFAEEQYRPRTERELAKVGVAIKEVESIGKAVVAALAKGPLSTDALRRALPEGTVRSLGEKGKKAGISSPLPAALRFLEFEGRVERVLEGGRLDSERYLWRVPAKNPIAGAKLPRDRGERLGRLGRIFLQHAGPATRDDFQCWSVLPQRDARVAFESAGAVPVRIDGYAAEAFVLEEQADALKKARTEKDSVALLAMEDNYLTMHGGPGPLTDPEHHGRKIEAWGMSRATTLGEARHVAMRTLVLGDRVSGFWEYDPEAQELVAAPFAPLSPKQTRAVEEAAQAVIALFAELGHARSFSLDTMEEVAARAHKLRAVKTAKTRPAKKKRERKIR
jgi:hypothetical protein